MFGDMEHISSKLQRWRVAQVFPGCFGSCHTWLFRFNNLHDFYVFVKKKKKGNLNITVLVS